MSEHPAHLQDDAVAPDTPDTPDAPKDAAAERRARIEPIARLVAVFVMPLLIVGMMISGYLGSMHHQALNDAPVVVTGSAAQIDDFREAARDEDDGAVDIDTVSSAAEARDRVERREATAAIVFDGDAATVYTASAAGATVANATSAFVTPLLLEQGATVTTSDLVPLPASDAGGLGAIFLATALVMAGYLPFSVARTNSPEILRFRRAVPLMAAWAALAAGIAWLVTGPVLEIVPSDLWWGVLGVAWLSVFAIASVQLFLTRLFGSLGAIVGLLLLMVLGMPSSNLSVSVYMVPDFFRVLHHFLPMASIGESMRSVLYFQGDGLQGSLLVLAIGAVAGLLLTAIFDATLGRRYPDGVATDVTMPSLHGGKRPRRRLVRYGELLLFPLAMVSLMLSSLLGALHDPSPRDMPVAVVGATTDQANQAIEGIQEQLPDTFDLSAHASDDLDQVTAQIEDRDIVAAFVLPSADNPNATLIGNQAGSASAYQVAMRIFTPIAAAQQLTLDVDDLHPLPDRDNQGVTVMYIAMGWILAGFLVVIVAANAAPATRPLRSMLPILAGYAPLASGLLWLVFDPITGAVDGHFPALWGVGMLAIVAVAFTTMVFERLLGMFAIIPTVGILMFLGVPSANAALSMYMAPDMFRVLHDFLPMPAVAEIARSILYFDGDVVLPHLQTLIIWGLVSLVLVVLVGALRPPRTAHDFGFLAAAPGPAGGAAPSATELPTAVDGFIAAEDEPELDAALAAHSDTEADERELTPAR